MEKTEAPVLLNPVDALEAVYEKDGLAERNGKRVKRGVVRASSVGHQPRRLMFDYFPEYATEAIKGRGCRTFEVGDQRHDSLRAKLLRAEVPGRIPVAKAMEEEWEMPIPGTTWILRGHPDGVLYAIQVKGIEIPKALLEIKTTGSFGWRDVMQGVIDAKYLLTSYAHCEALGLPWIYFLYERKDTQHLCEVLVPHDPRALEYALSRVAEAVLAIEAGLKPLDMRACEGEDYGWVSRKVAKMGTVLALGWRCSYCPFMAECFPTYVRWLSGGKPIVTEPQSVPPEAVVVDMGIEVIPEPSWKLSGDAEESTDG